MIAKQRLGKDLLILAHHYQQSDTFWFADISGDSLYLAQQAAKTAAKYVIFCGVHFMAESADVLTKDNQNIILPSLSAGCSMADMADSDTVQDCWDILVEYCGEDSFIPVTYINSSAELKAFCASHGGTVCTSSNAQTILKWVFSQGKKVMFFPDQHLGRNTANALGVPGEQIVLWDRQKEAGGIGKKKIQNSQVLLWDGYCSIHCRFTATQIQNARERDPSVQVIVHPECPEDVVELADYTGSTNKIISLIKGSAPGTNWVVGTEINLVNRLALEMQKENKIISLLNPNVCICSTMYRVHPANVLWVLENLLEQKVVNKITVPESVKKLSRVALDRMLELSQ